MSYFGVFSIVQFYLSASGFTVAMATSVSNTNKLVLGVLVLIVAALCLFLERYSTHFLTSNPLPVWKFGALLSVPNLAPISTPNESALLQTVPAGGRHLEGLDLPQYSLEDNVMDKHKPTQYQSMQVESTTSPYDGTMPSQLKGQEKVSDSFKNGRQAATSIKSFNPPPNLPWDIKNPGLLMSQPWVKRLWTILSTDIGKRWPVTITASNYEFRSALLNWLALSLVNLGSDSVQNVLVISMDSDLHNLLHERNISSLLVPYQTLVKDTKRKLRSVGVVRVTVMRLINHWGYDVVNYDSDAFILKNPQKLFDLYPDSHVIGSEAYMPKDLHKKWGVTLCMGMVFIRASPEAEKLWLAVHELDVQDDQKRLNYALNKLGLTFHKRGTATEPWQGLAPLSNPPSRLNVTVITNNKVCRGVACKPNAIGNYYVYHQGGNHDFRKMVNRAGKARVWVLRKDWETLSSTGQLKSLTGREWLRALLTF